MGLNRLVHLGGALKAGGHNGDAHLIAQALIKGSTPDDVGIGMGALGDHAGSGLDILQTNVGAGGDVDDDAARTGDAGLQQRAGDGSLGGVLGLAGALGNADTHVGKAGVLHDGADIREVEVDEGGDVDQAGDALNALTQHIVGGLEGVHQGDLLLTDELQALVRDDDQRVDMHHQGGNALLGLRHLALALKGEGLCDDANGQDAQIMGSLGHDRGSARAGAAAHTGGDKDHLRTLQGVGDLILALLGGALADLRVSTGTAALGQLGAKLTKGRGAGADPEIGQRAAEESKDEITNALKGAQMVFITAGMGGGTGTGAAPVVAETAHDLGILTVGIVTKPFAFEGKRKMAQAEQGIASLMMHVDSLIVIPNERLKLISQEKITLMNAFEAADNVLRQGVESISSLINIPAFINLDFADVRSIMKDAGFAHMGVGVAKGAGKAENAAKAAISSPLLETSIAGARGVIINITSSPDIGLEDVETAASMITQSAHPDANIIWGTAFDERLSDEMSITVVATGFESTPEVDEPIQAHVDAKRAAQQTAVQQPAQPVQPVQPAAPVQPAQQPINPPMPNPIFTQSFSTGMDTPVAAQPAAPAEEEDDGDYFDDLLSILNKRS